MPVDYYAALGVAADASDDDIKRAFRKLSQVHHPDVRGTGDIYTSITEAYYVLSSPERRERYDRGLPQDETICEAEFPPGTRVRLRANRGVIGTVVTWAELTTEDAGLGFALPSSAAIIVRWDQAYPAVAVNPEIEHAGPESEKPEPGT